MSHAEKGQHTDDEQDALRRFWERSAVLQLDISSCHRQMLLALDRDEDTIINSFVWRHVRHGQSVIGWMVKHLANGRDALVGARRPDPGHLQQGRKPS